MHKLYVMKIVIKVYTFPVESAQRTLKGLGFLLILETPFEKASLFFKGSAFREVGFN